ncbi:hypothetical protein IN84_13995, partial [Salmonella enterica]
SQCPSLPVVWAFLWAKHRHDPALNIAVLVDQRLGHEGRVFFGVVVPFPDLVGVKSVGANPPSDWDSDQGAFCLKVLEPVPNRAGANLQMVSQELLIADNSATGRVDVFSEEGIQASGPRIAL